MSGGALDYVFGRVRDAGDGLSTYVEDHIDELRDHDDTLAELQCLVEEVQEFSNILYELEWYMSEDTGPERFKQKYDEYMKWRNAR